MPIETYGFKDWQKLNDAARQDLEEELSTQIHEELNARFYRTVNDWIGDLIDAFNMPREETEQLMVANLDVWLENMTEEFDGEDVIDAVNKRKEARDRGK